MRKSCFKSLASACLAALKRGTALAASCQRTEIRERLGRIVPAAPELEVCIKYLDQLEADSKKTV
jgi:hypothetical protein